MDARAAATVEPAFETARKERQRLTADHLLGIEKFEADLWKIADNLRANSNLASNEYFMPIMGLIFLRHATNRFYEAKAAIEADKAAGKIPDRPLVEADFTRRQALNLPKSARFDLILKSPKDGNLGAARRLCLSEISNLVGAPEEIRTPDPQIRSLVPPDTLPTQGRGESTRSAVGSVGSCPGWFVAWVFTIPRGPSMGSRDDSFG
jgi:hypothetical protein